MFETIPSQGFTGEGGGGGGGGGIRPLLELSAPFRNFKPLNLNTAHYMHASTLMSSSVLLPSLGNFPK